MDNDHILHRIEINARVCGGKPVIRGTRVPVTVILDRLACDESWDHIMHAFPQLDRADIQAAIRFARKWVDLSEVETTSTT